MIAIKRALFFLVHKIEDYLVAGFDEWAFREGCSKEKKGKKRSTKMDKSKEVLEGERESNDITVGPVFRGYGLVECQREGGSERSERVYREASKLFPVRDSASS